MPPRLPCLHLDRQLLPRGFLEFPDGRRGRTVVASSLDGYETPHRRDRHSACKREESAVGAHLNDFVPVSHWYVRPTTPLEPWPALSAASRALQETSVREGTSIQAAGRGLLRSRFVFARSTRVATALGYD